MLKFFNSKKDNALTAEMIAQFRRERNSLKGSHATAEAMWNLTKETIYMIAMKTVGKTLKMNKKVLSRGVCKYAPNSTTARRLAAYQKAKPACDNIVIMMELKRTPRKAESMLTKWVQATLDMEEEKKRAKELSEAEKLIGKESPEEAAENAKEMAKTQKLIEIIRSKTEKMVAKELAEEIAENMNMAETQMLIANILAATKRGFSEETIAKAIESLEIVDLPDMAEADDKEEDDEEETKSGSEIPDFPREYFI
ncbi:unnamed protein product [Caenorhabditis sp. 36 PRJEB53466]|nr:unnamed protein product [Caenorhabditis sp. 36 PRJEB53466]